MVVGVVNEFGRRQDLLRHHGAVPVAGPALVHDLGLCLGRKVIRLIANDGQDIPLPGLQGSMLDEKKKDVLLGLLGKAA